MQPFTSQTGTLRPPWASEPGIEVKLIGMRMRLDRYRPVLGMSLALMESIQRSLMTWEDSIGVKMQGEPTRVRSELKVLDSRIQTMSTGLRTTRTQVGQVMVEAQEMVGPLMMTLELPMQGQLQLDALGQLIQQSLSLLSDIESMQLTVGQLEQWQLRLGQALPPEL